MSSARFTGYYVTTALALAKDIHKQAARSLAQSQGRALGRLEDVDVGFLKARTASALKSWLINCGTVPPEMHGEFRTLLRDTANFLLLLPDRPSAAAAPRTRETRYVPGVD